MLLISVIVPVYKTEAFLRTCIESILNQTYSHLELILIDDGSPDCSGKICDEYAKKDVRIKVLHQKNSGVAQARNAGLDCAIGDYITFVDSDDFIQPQMYEKMINCVQKYDCDLVLCDCMKLYSGGKKELYTHKIQGGYYNEERLHQEYYPHLLILPNIEYPATISNWVCLFKNTYKQLPCYEIGVRYSEDWLFGCQLMLQVNSFYYMKGQAYYNYNCNNLASATHSFSIDKWNDFKKIFMRFQEDFGNNKTHDFSSQLDKVLLFFVYNAVGDILGTDSLSNQQKCHETHNILCEDIVKTMFKRLRIDKLNISAKLKVLTWCYAHPVTIPIVVFWYGRKKG